MDVTVKLASLVPSLLAIIAFPSIKREERCDHYQLTINQRPFETNNKT